MSSESRSGRPTVEIPITDDMLAAARILRWRLTHDQYNQLFEAIVQLESDDLIIVDSAAERQPALFPNVDASDDGTGDDS